MSNHCTVQSIIIIIIINGIWEVASTTMLTGLSEVMRVTFQRPVAPPPIVLSKYTGIRPKKEHGIFILEMNISTLIWPKGFLQFRKCYSSLKMHCKAVIVAILLLIKTSDTELNFNEESY